MKNFAYLKLQRNYHVTFFCYRNFFLFEKDSFIHKPFFHLVKTIFIFIFVFIDKNNINFLPIIRDFAIKIRHSNLNESGYQESDFRV